MSPLSLSTVQGPSTLTLRQLASGEAIPEEPGHLSVSVSPGQWAELVGALEARDLGQAVSIEIQGEAPGDWPTDAQLARLVALECVELRVPWVMELGEPRAEQAAHFIRFLRDCTSHRLRVRWRGAALSPVAPWRLYHLEPPESGGLPELDEAACQWQQAHAYGRCYWRAGPGFVLVKDRREGRVAAQFLLDDAATRSMFETLAVPRRVESLGTEPEARKALADLEEEALVLGLGPWRVVLPFRMRCWPVPFIAV
uniref:Uncharacterized protein n=1 Tax=Corallococcus coralloides TaxID=184914 RepID=A0A3S5GXQ5_CORCK|nr:hypothetical protein [Corallococcus coralloides]